MEVDNEIGQGRQENSPASVAMDIGNEIVQENRGIFDQREIIQASQLSEIDHDNQENHRQDLIKASHLSTVSQNIKDRKPFFKRSASRVCRFVDLRRSCPNVVAASNVLLPSVLPLSWFVVSNTLSST